MAYARLDALEASQTLLDRLRNHDRSVAAAGAADADRQVRLSFRDVLRDQEAQQVQRVLEELVRRVGLVEERADLAIAARVRAAASARSAGSAGTARRTADRSRPGCRA
jgi:hypothetical protein